MAVASHDTNDITQPFIFGIPQISSSTTGAPPPPTDTRGQRSPGSHAPCTGEDAKIAVHSDDLTKLGILGVATGTMSYWVGYCGWRAVHSRNGYDSCSVKQELTNL